MKSISSGFPAQVPRRPIHIAGVFFWLIFFLLAGRGEVWADRGREGAVDPPPPLAQTVGVQVFRGESVRIPLQARGRAAAEARFLIRSSPTMGALGEVQTYRPGIALVEYTHRGGPTDEVDSFSYAAQAPGTPVSAPARITVRIVDRPPELRHPDEVDFGSVLVGESVQQYVFLQNLGGLPLFTEIEIEPEWRLPKGKVVEIPPRGTVEWPVEFSPDSDQDYAGVMRFSHNDRAVVRFFGAGKEPLRWTPQSLEIRQEEPSVLPKIELLNRTEEMLEVRVSAGEGVRVPETLRLPPEESVSLSWELVPGVVTGADGEIVVEHELGQARIPYRIFPQPAQLVILPPGGVEFEPVLPRVETTAEVLLQNRGGLPVNISLDSTAGVEFRGVRNFAVAPGETREVTLVFAGRDPGPAQGQMQVRVGGEIRVVPWRGFIGEGRDRTAGMESPRISGTALDASDAAQRPSSRSSLVAAGSGERPAQSGMAQWEDITVLTPTTTSLVLEWKVPLKPGQELQLQTRIWMLNENDNPELTWIPLPNVDVFVPREGVARATLYRLVPDSRLLLRYQVHGPTGRLEVESEVLALSIPAAAAGWSIPWFWLFLIAAVAGIVWFIRRRRAAEQAEADAAVRRLEKIN